MNRRQFLLTLGSVVSAASGPDLSSQWKRIARDTDGRVGAAAMHLGTGTLVSIHGDDRFPLASVCKLPIAMHILALVDEQKLSLDDQIEVLPQDVWSGVSEIERRWPAQQRFILDEMLE